MIEEYDVKISKIAKHDLNDIIIYIKEKLNEPSIAKKYLHIMKKEIQKLKYYPQKNAVISDHNIKNLNIRKLIIRNYIVFYRINEHKKIVNVERIFYGASNWIQKL